MNQAVQQFPIYALRQTPHALPCLVQCGRFQPVEEFDSNKKSCRAQLEKHNARRRKAGQADPPPKRSRALSIVVVEAPPSGSPQVAVAHTQLSIRAHGHTCLLT